MESKIVTIPVVVDGQVCFVSHKSRKHRKKNKFCKVLLGCLAAAALIPSLTAKPSSIEEHKMRQTQPQKIEQVALQPTEAMDLLETLAPTLEELQNPIPETQSAEFTVTAYCSCEICCGKWALNRQGPVVGAAGVPLVPGVSVAVDTDYIPLGTKLYDENGNEYIAADTGSGVVGYWMDIYMVDHQSARNWGKQTLTLSWAVSSDG